MQTLHWLSHKALVHFESKWKKKMKLARQNHCLVSFSASEHITLAEHWVSSGSLSSLLSIGSGLSNASALGLVFWESSDIFFLFLPRLFCYTAATDWKPGGPFHCMLLHPYSSRWALSLATANKNVCSKNNRTSFFIIFVQWMGWISWHLTAITSSKTKVVQQTNAEWLNL